MGSVQAAAAHLAIWAAGGQKGAGALEQLGARQHVDLKWRMASGGFGTARLVCHWRASWSGAAVAGRGMHCANGRLAWCAPSTTGSMHSSWFGSAGGPHLGWVAVVPPCRHQHIERIRHSISHVASQQAPPLVLLLRSPRGRRLLSRCLLLVRPC